MVVHPGVSYWLTWRREVGEKPLHLLNLLMVLRDMCLDCERGVGIGEVTKLSEQFIGCGNGKSGGEYGIDVGRTVYKSS